MGRIKILGAGELGYGGLIEEDAGYLSGDIDSKIINENANIKLNVGEPVLVNCILQKWGVKNKNGRIYPKDVLIAQSIEYQKLIDGDTAVSESDHPDSSTISLHNISHKIIKMWWGTGEQENVLYGQIRLVVTRGFIEQGIVSVIGDKIVLYLQHKIKLGISSRGVGTLKEIRGENIVQDDFELIGFDLVSTPSTPGAYLFPVDTKELSFKEEYKRTKSGIYLNESDSVVISLDRFLM